MVTRQNRGDGRYASAARPASSMEELHHRTRQNVAREVSSPNAQTAGDCRAASGTSARFPPIQRGRRNRGSLEADQQPWAERGIAGCWSRNRRGYSEAQAHKASTNERKGRCRQPGSAIRPSGCRRGRSPPWPADKGRRRPARCSELLLNRRGAPTTTGPHPTPPMALRATAISSRIRRRRESIWESS